MSQRALSPQLFHGTAALIQPGQRVLPAAKRNGHSNWGDTGSGKGQRSRDHAFATTTEDTAWYFANTAAHNGDGNYGERPRVYTVAPNPRMKPGVHGDLDEFIAPSFKVQDRIDVMPGHQGTINTAYATHSPDVEQAGPFNWAPFHAKRNAVAANHPAPEVEKWSTPASRNRGVAGQQLQALYSHRLSLQPEGQGELFSPAKYGDSDPSSPNHVRAGHHLLRSLVNSGQVPGTEVDHRLAEEESLDAHNRRKGRRSSFAARYLERAG